MKYAPVLIILMVLSGCSALRKAGSTEPAGGKAVANYSELARTVSDYNVGSRGFEIRKGTIELTGTEIEGKFGLHARLNSRGDFYGSVRGPLGIELIRILMVGNDIAAIDRINRTVYIGKKDDVLRRNGMPEDLMSIILGDMPERTNDDFSSNYRNQVNVTSTDEYFRREISICVDEMKVCFENIESLNSGHHLFMTFNDFVISGGVKYPSVILMEEKKKMFHVKLSISELISGYDSDIGFNLPSYKRESL